MISNRQMVGRSRGTKSFRWSSAETYKTFLMVANTVAAFTLALHLVAHPISPRALIGDGVLLTILGVATLRCRERFIIWSVALAVPLFFRLAIVVVTLNSPGGWRVLVGWLAVAIPIWIAALRFKGRSDFGAWREVKPLEHWAPVLMLIVAIAGDYLWSLLFS
jgi:hypothetical protein